MSPHQESAIRKKDCWNTCDYPSECRWGKKFGIHTPTPNTSTFPILELCSEPISPSSSTKSEHVEGVLKTENVAGLEQDKADFWGALIASAKRRKSETPSSPLASVAEEDEDGDTVMTSPSSSSDSSPSTSPTTVGSAAMDMLKDLMKRKTARKERTAPTLSRAHSNPVGVPELEVPKPVLRLKNEDQVCLSEGEAFLEGFEPLERVRSRKDLGALGTVRGL